MVPPLPCAGAPGPTTPCGLDPVFDPCPDDPGDEFRSEFMILYVITFDATGFATVATKGMYVEDGIGTLRLAEIDDLGLDPASAQLLFGEVAIPNLSDDSSRDLNAAPVVNMGFATPPCCVGQPSCTTAQCFALPVQDVFVRTGGFTTDNLFVP